MVAASRAAAVRQHLQTTTDTWLQETSPGIGALSMSAAWLAGRQCCCPEESPVSIQTQSLALRLDGNRAEVITNLHVLVLALGPQVLENCQGLRILQTVHYA